jgi:NAD+ synthase (glutamine-hydrolysing)
VHEVEALEPVEEIYRALVLGTRDYVTKNGFKHVVIGLSGGIDSSIVAAVAVDALGAANVTGVTMPSPFSSRGTRNDAARLAKNLGIDLLRVPITSVLKAYKRVLAGAFKGLKEDVTEENLQARIRGNYLMALSNKFGWLVLNTGNKSEIAVGYTTLYGDMAGGFRGHQGLPEDASCTSSPSTRTSARGARSSQERLHSGRRRGAPTRSDRSGLAALLRDAGCHPGVLRGRAI